MILIIGGDSDMSPAIKSLYPEAILVPKKKCDVTDLMMVKKWVSYYKPDTVINLAGVSNLQPVIGSKPDDWYEEIIVNLVGSYNVAKASVELGVKTMIFIGSVAGKYGKKNHSGYCASKAGVISLVQSLAQEGYNAYCISPGRTDTKLREKDFPGEDVLTRLTTKQIANVVQEILDDKHTPGDNLIIRKRGYKTLRRIDKGEPWKSYLNIGGKVVR